MRIAGGLSGAASAPDLSSGVAAAPVTGQPYVMITNGGPHPARKWADMTAGDLIRIQDPWGGNLRHWIGLALVRIYEKAAAGEPITALAQEAVSRIRSEISQTRWADHYVSDQAVTDLTDTLMRHLAMAQDEARRNPVERT